eukprot:scaffold474_cov169-Ochromonas_danica.AAC.25
MSNPSSSSLNPFAVLCVSSGCDMLPIGFTEVIKNTTEPQWMKEFVVDYNFERIQQFTVKIFDYNASHPIESLRNHKIIGQISFPLAELIRRTNLCYTLSSDPACCLEIVGEVLAKTRDNLVVTFSAMRLSNKEGFFSTSDPFLRISRVNEDGSWTPVWTNKHIKSTLNPCWAASKIPLTLLCNGDFDRPLRIGIFGRLSFGVIRLPPVFCHSLCGACLVLTVDWEKSGKHVFMGQVDTSVRQILTNDGKKALNVIEPAVQLRKKSYVNSGILLAGYPQIEYNPTFGDYIQGGCEISLVLGIDFTASNRDPIDPDSLHYLDPTGRTMNVYERALSTICPVLEPYDADNLYPVYGFGAKLRAPDGSWTPAQHCFPVYGGGAEVKGTQGILQAYRAALPAVMLSGPTLFAPLIIHATELAKNAHCTQQTQKYFILLLITDGEINDMEETKQAVINASNYPLSIIIVGVGPADFTSMHELDSDERLLTNGRITAVRDIVQFVAFRECGNQPELMAQSVLAELPGQLLLYMKQNNIAPNTAQYQNLGSR